MNLLLIEMKACSAQLSEDHVVQTNQIKSVIIRL